MPVANPASTPSKRRVSPVRLFVLVALIAAAIGGGGVLGLQWWNDSSTFVSTDNAQIAGRLIYIGTTSAGRISSVRFDVGQAVVRDQVIATLYAPVPVGMMANGQPRLAFRETSDALVEVKSHVDGVVIARGVEVGDTVPVGQSLLTVVDPRQLWVNANIEETQVRRVRKGQDVIIHVDSLNIDVPGRVAAITPATAATFALLPSQNSSGNFTKATQLVPVKVEISQPDPRLLIGTSANVRVRVRDE